GRGGHVEAAGAGGHHRPLLGVKRHLAAERVAVVVVQGAVVHRVIVDPPDVRAADQRGGIVAEVHQERVGAVGEGEAIAPGEVQGGAAQKGGGEAAGRGGQVVGARAAEDVQFVVAVHHHAVRGIGTGTAVVGAPHQGAAVGGPLAHAH